MPFASKAQARLFFAKEARGELPRGTARRWMHETQHFARLPEYVGYADGYYSFGQDEGPVRFGKRPAPLPPVKPVTPEQPRQVTTEPAPAAMPADAPKRASWWAQHGSEIIVGTITAVTGGLAVYFAMRLVERGR